MICSTVHTETKVYDSPCIGRILRTKKLPPDILIKKACSVLFPIDKIKTLDSDVSKKNKLSSLVDVCNAMK